MEKAVLDLFVPGRVCLLGEHSDWAGGWRRENPALLPGRALLVGTSQGQHARVRRCPGKLRLRATLENGSRTPWFELPMRREALLEEAQAGSFASYVAGVAYQVLKRHAVGGVEIDNHATDLPLAKGLSSSAAACVLAARAFGRLYNLGLSRREEMELAYLGETTTPSLCGRLDQGCAYGQQPVLMVFDGEDLQVELLRVGAELHLVLVNLRAQKDTRRILADLNRCYPYAQSELGRGVHLGLGVENHRITAAAVRALALGQVERFGALMLEAQAVFDRLVAPACPSELAAPALHAVLAEPRLEPYLLGAKGVGSQGDGTAQLLCRDADGQQRVMELVRRELGLGALELTIPATE